MMKMFQNSKLEAPAKAVDAVVEKIINAAK
ncbi:MAG: hypothetical protein ICCCNLDF_00026 [Planctomycetes bacterium]|nr:hypothetical protein [Planctomycetota bacterium]